MVISITSSDAVPIKNATTTAAAGKRICVTKSRCSMNDETRKEANELLVAIKDLTKEPIEDLIEVRQILKVILFEIENEMDRRKLI